jgi:SAM-dependent methyltransferase
VSAPDTYSAAGHGGSPSHGVDEYWWYLARTDLLRVGLGDYVGEAALALDIGSADGPSAGWFRETVAHTVSLDIDPRGLGTGGVCGSAYELPFGDGTFDLVCAFDVVEHTDPESASLREIRRVLRPGGRLLMTVPAYQWAWSDHDVANGHHRRYTRPRAVAAVEDAGLRVERATYGFSATFPLFAVERLARRVRGMRSTGPADTVEIPHVPRPLHHALMGLMRIDRAVLARGHDLPFGSSVLVAATRVD